MKRVLVANRGEIALRIGRTLRRMGLGWVAVYTPAEGSPPHARAADSAAEVPSYLDSAALLAAARALKADAVHPGYGFLAESAEFAEAVLAAGLVWIGPPPGPMRLMADKGRARAAALAAGVPVLPGFEGDTGDDRALIEAAQSIGFPLMVKAAAGGGGRGMRLVAEPAALPAALARARSEAAAAFGDGRLILERAVMAGRHVEVQVFGDATGRVIHLGERDCSVQRRHQKIVEEAPAPGLSPALAAAIREAGVTVAKAAGYQGAGTVEFLLEPSGAFWFLEMNTRLQVEHPVTEAITGLDLVEWQIRVARGEPLPDQAAIRFSGHAIEVRLCAEDPAQGFLPQTGRILHWAPPAGLRADHALEAGLEVTAGFDSLLAKLIAHGPDRDTARQALIAGLKATELLGLITNRRALIAILEHPLFAAGAPTTDFLDRALANEPGFGADPLQATELALAGGALALAAGRGDQRLGWSTAPPMPRRMRFETQGKIHEATLTFARGQRGLVVRTGEAELELLSREGPRLCFHQEGVLRALPCLVEGSDVYLPERMLRDATHDPAPRRGTATGGEVTAPMAGRIVSVAVAEGESVNAGQTLAVIEAMKMEMPILAPLAGRVVGLAVRAGEQVAARALLLRIEEPT